MMKTLNPTEPGGRLSFRKAILSVIALTFILAPSASARDSGAQGGVSAWPVSSDKLPNSPGNTMIAVVVDFAPGASSPRHHHAGFVFAYVLSGTIRSQLDGGKITDFTAGQSWVEPPGTEHTMSANPSTTEKASLLAVFVAPDNAQLTTYDK